MPDTRAAENQDRMETTAEIVFEAWTELRRGGHYEVRWHQGYRAEGQFTGPDAPRRAH